MQIIFAGRGCIVFRQFYIRQLKRPSYRTRTMRIPCPFGSDTIPVRFGHHTCVVSLTFFNLLPMRMEQTHAVLERCGWFVC